MKHFVLLLFLGFCFLAKGQGKIIGIDIYNFVGLGILHRDSLALVHKIEKKSKYSIVNQKKNFISQVQYDKSGLTIFSNAINEEFPKRMLVKTKLTLLKENEYEIATSLPVSKLNRESVASFLGEVAAKYFKEDKASIFQIKSIYRMHVDSIFEIYRYYKGIKIDSFIDPISASIYMKDTSTFTVSKGFQIENIGYQVKDSFVKMKTIFDSLQNNKWATKSFYNKAGLLLKNETFNFGDSNTYYCSKEMFAYYDNGKLFKKYVTMQVGMRSPPIEIDSFIFWRNGRIKEIHIDENGTWPRWPDKITQFNEQGLKINEKVIKIDYTNIDAITPVILESKYFYNKRNDLIKEIRLYKGKVSDEFIYVYQYFD